MRRPPDLGDLSAVAGLGLLWWGLEGFRPFLGTTTVGALLTCLAAVLLLRRRKAA